MIRPAAAKPVAMIVMTGVAAITLGACQASTPTPSPSPTGSGGSVSPSASTTPTASSPSPSPSAVLACTAVDLSVRLGAGSGGGAGHRYPYLVFTNDGAMPCLLSGHPAVTMVGGGSGQAIGAAAKPVSSTAKTVTLKPGKSAHAALDVAQAENFDAGECQPKLADGFRVVLPNDTGALFAAATDYVACANASVPLMTVKPFVGGAK